DAESTAAGRIDRGDVNLAHRQHRLERAARLLTAARQCLQHRAGGDLPVDSPAVPAPAALAGLAAVSNDRVPVAIGLLLVLGQDLERERLALGVHRSTVQSGAVHAAHGELHHQFVSLLATGEVARRVVDRDNLAVRKYTGIELRRLASAVVIPEADAVLGDVHLGSPADQGNESE